MSLSFISSAGGQAPQLILRIQFAQDQCLLKLASFSTSAWYSSSKISIQISLVRTVVFRALSMWINYSAPKISQTVYYFSRSKKKMVGYQHGSMLSSYSSKPTSYSSFSLLVVPSFKKAVKTTVLPELFSPLRPTVSMTVGFGIYSWPATLVSLSQLMQ